MNYIYLLFNSHRVYQSNMRNHVLVKWMKASCISVNENHVLLKDESKVIVIDEYTYICYFIAVESVPLSDDEKPCIK